MVVKYDYRFLRGFIKENFGSNDKYAKFLGIGTTALYERLACNIPFRQTEIDATAKYGDLTGWNLWCRFMVMHTKQYAAFLMGGHLSWPAE